MNQNEMTPTLVINEYTRCTYKLPTDSNDFTRPKTKYECPYKKDKEYPDKPFCVFHVHKLTERELQGLNSSQLAQAERVRAKFNRGINSMMKDVESGVAERLDFRGFIFPYIQFRPGFRGESDFSHALFTRDIEFSEEVMSNIYEYETVGGLLFSKGVTFRHARFMGKARFSDITFHADADFRNATFEKDALFNGTLFEKSNNFDNVRFNETVNFTGAEFRQLGQFNHSTYAQKADFTQSAFDSGATFYKAAFHAETLFDNILFGKDLESSPESKVSKDDPEDYVYIVFDSAKFSDNVSFEDAFFDGDVSFNNVTFEKDARFISERTWVFGSSADFTRIVLRKDSKLVFFRVDLSRARFHDTNLEFVSFRDVKWAGAHTRLGKFLRGRAHILWDEIRPLEGMRDWLDDAKTAENYRQLVLNFEAKRDYDGAEYFHIGEMEMRRRNRSARTEEALFQPLWWLNLRRYINGHGLYWLSSRYGTSYTQALGILFVMVLCFSWLFLYAGFQRVREGADNPVYTIEYNLLPDHVHHSVSLSQWAADFEESISFALSILTFQRDRFYQPLNARSRFVLYLSVFLLAAQGALTLLAIRRRFKR